MKKSLFSFLLCVFLAACQTQGVRTGATGKSSEAGDTGIGSGEEAPVASSKFTGDLSDPSGPSDPSGSVLYNSAPSPMPSGTVAPIHDFPGYWANVAAGEQTTTCSLLAGLKVVHLRGRIGIHHCDANDCDAPVAEQDLNSDLSVDVDRLRVIHLKGSKGFYSQDVPLVASQPVHFDLDLETSNPSSLRFYAYKRFEYQPSGASLQPCTSDECIDDISHVFLPPGSSEVRVKLANKLKDVSGEDPLPPCIERAMVIEKVQLRQTHILDQ